MPSPWPCLEALPGQSAVSAVWYACLQEDYETFPFLQPKETTVKSFPCLGTGCAFRVIHKPDGSIIGVCRSNPPMCTPIQLTLAEITPLQLNWQKLGRALCKALGLDTKTTKLDLPSTLQIGSWSADAVPVILTIQCDGHLFRHVVAELVARLGRPFILLAPTSIHLTVHCDELLAHAKAAFFPLETTVVLTSHGTLLPKKFPGELFARFTPQPSDSVGEDVARQTLALAKALDSEQRFRKAPVYTVFLLYCSEGLAVNQIAKTREREISIAGAQSLTPTTRRTLKNKSVQTLDITMAPGD